MNIGILSPHHLPITASLAVSTVSDTLVGIQ